MTIENKFEGMEKELMVKLANNELEETILSKKLISFISTAEANVGDVKELMHELLEVCNRYPGNSRISTSAMARALFSIYSSTDYLHTMH